MDKVLVNHNSGAFAMTGPNEVTVYTVRVGCVQSQVSNETAEITLLNTVDTTRPVKTIPRNTTRYSHDSLGHCESSIKEVEKLLEECVHERRPHDSHDHDHDNDHLHDTTTKGWRSRGSSPWMSHHPSGSWQGHPRYAGAVTTGGGGPINAPWGEVTHNDGDTLRADHKCDRDRRAAWTITQCTVNAEEQTSLSKWMSKDYHGEVAKLAEWSWSRSAAMQSKIFF